ncbi:MAG: helix-turn-helix domain-containing protein [Victivallales bacterium]|nr:helix-turn-helix domain-containing protein [Victivallales bacterium]
MNAIDSMFKNPFVAGETSLSGEDCPAIYRPYGMERWILNCTVLGGGRINSGVEMFTVSEGDFLLFPPGVRHDYGKSPCHACWRHLWAYFDPETQWLPLMKWPQAAGGVLMLSIADKNLLGGIRGALKKVVSSYNSHLSRRLSLCRNYLEECLLLIDSATPGGGAQSDPRIRRALDMMDKELGGSLDVAAIAKACGMSKSRFAHLFKQDMGTSPMRYLQARRIEEAGKLLISRNATVGEVAFSSGFGDQMYFSKVFKKITGRTPREFKAGG